MFAFSLSWVSIFLRLIRCRLVPEKMEGKERGGRNSFGRCCFGCRIKIERLDEEWRFLFCMGPKGLGKLKIHNLCVFFNCNFFFTNQSKHRRCVLSFICLLCLVVREMCRKDKKLKHTFYAIFFSKNLQTGLNKGK